MAKRGSAFLIKNLIKDKEVATISPSSKFLIKKIIRGIDFNQDLLFVEYGAGTGPITNTLLEKMSKNSELIAVEKNIVLFNLLQNFKDKRLKLLNEDLRNIENITKSFNKKKADYIISGIPFSMLTSEEKNKIIKETRKILSDKGKLILYQTSFIMKKYLAKAFHRVKVRFEPINIPPMFILEACK